ncbi:hypothetical protein LXG23DRAFT_54173 [Yarrowia lipolytica]|nr:hypothetical protein LXG23DRAFT_54173 [Yarrowia lipolytica]
MQPSRPQLAINPFIKHSVSYLPHGRDFVRTAGNLKTLALWLTPVLGWAFGVYAYKRVKFDKQAGIYQSFGHSTFDPRFMNKKPDHMHVARAVSRNGSAAIYPYIMFICPAAQICIQTILCSGELRDSR